jgi:hypothetical protein
MGLLIPVRSSLLLPIHDKLKRPAKAAFRDRSGIKYQHPSNPSPQKLDTCMLNVVNLETSSARPFLVAQRPQGSRLNAHEFSINVVNIFDSPVSYFNIFHILMRNISSKL